MAEELMKKGHSCVCFGDLQSFYCAINKTGYTADLLIIDYTVWNHLNYSFVKYQKNNDLFIPFIYFNDPCISKPYALSYIYVLRAVCANFDSTVSIEKEDELVKKLEKTFSDVAAIVESETISPYMPLMRQLKEFPDDLPIKDSFKFLSKLVNKKFNMNEFREKVKLPKSSEFLLNIFLSNIDNSLSKKFICDEYHKQSKKMSEKSISPLVSKLKSYIRMDKDFPYILFDTKDGYTLVSKGELK